MPEENTNIGTQNQAPTAPAPSAEAPNANDNAPTQQAGNLGGGTATPSQKPVEPTTVNADKPIEQRFTQDQVNEFIRQRLERDRGSMYKRYGVKDKNEFESLVGKAQSFGIMKERYGKIRAENAELREKMAFMVNNINPAKEAEIKALFKGYGLEFNEDNLKQQLLTHPEWLNAPKVDNTPKSTFRTIGVEHQNRNIPEGEDAKQKRMFGV